MTPPADAAPATPFTALVGCRVPIQLAAMGGVSTPALAGAVAAAGGLGMLSGTALAPGELAGQVADAAAAAGAGATGRIGVGFLMPFLDRTVLEATAPLVSVVECFYGAPDAGLVGIVHDAGTLAAWQVGGVDEARAAVDVGCDVLVVQGVEAGGHVRGDRPLLDLLGEVRPLTDGPIVGAGGIGTGGQAAAVLDAGADAVRVGTRFLATAEADVHPDYAAALVAAGADDTVVTRAFSLAWPDAPHRVLRSCVDASDADPSTRLPLPPTRAFTGDVGAAALYAGRSVGAVTRLGTAAEVISELAGALGAAPRTRRRG